MSENHLIVDRKEKIKNWEAKGFAGYAKKFDRTHTADTARKAMEGLSLREAGDLMKNPVNPENALCGRIMQMRDMGKLAFLRIRDVSGDFQICLAKNVLGDGTQSEKNNAPQPGFKWFIKNLDLGDFCGFAGEFFLTKHGEPSLMAVEITPLAKTIRPMPEKFHGLTDIESCYRERNLDLMTNSETFERFQQRSHVVREIRDFFHEKDFFEIETPILQAQAGGAMAKTFETHHNALDHDFVLRIALELDHKRVIGGGLERVFEIGKNFRNEGTDPSHLQEFTMIEWYAAYENLETNKAWMEDLIRRICTKVYGKTVFEILDKDEKPVAVDFGKKFKTVTFAELLLENANIDILKISDEDLRKEAEKLGIEDSEKRGRGNLLDDIYKIVARPKLIQPTFVTDWPTDLKPLARPNENGTSDVYQLLVAGWEIINAYGELIDPMVQRQLFVDQQKAKDAGDDEAMEIDEAFLKAMEHGLPPMTGTGMGVDRLCALLSGMPNLRDVVLFPTMLPEAQKKDTTTKVAVAVLNPKAFDAPWQALNTVGHLAAAYGAREGKSLFHQDKLETSDKQKIKLNTEHAIMIKQTDSDAALKTLIAKAKEADLHVSEFTRAMLETSDDKKLVVDAKSKKYNEIEHLGVLIFGKKSTVEAVTKAYSLLESF